MQSMIKRKVDISMNAHIEMVQQLVLDAYTLNTERLIKQGRGQCVYQSGNAFCYRMLRQTGHSSALKKLLSREFMTENDLHVFGLFFTSRERDVIFSPSRNVTSGVEYPVDINESVTATIKTWKGTSIDKANIIVFSDVLHDPRRLELAQAMILEHSSHFPNLGLVVYLG